MFWAKNPVPWTRSHMLWTIPSCFMQKLLWHEDLSLGLEPIPLRFVKNSHDMKILAYLLNQFPHVLCTNSHALNILTSLLNHLTHVLCKNSHEHLNQSVEPPHSCFVQKLPWHEDPSLSREPIPPCLEHLNQSVEKPHSRYSKWLKAFLKYVSYFIITFRKIL